MEAFLMSGISVTLSGVVVSPEELTRLRAKLLPPYKVILWNDDHNDMDYVVGVLLRLINHLTAPEAIDIMLTTHLTGSAVVVVCAKEIAEYYQERLLSAGLTATIEPD
jgi:ATP-dependent Clp protease adaptor protein ClpS